ncbi:MAG: hypothetical protein J3K34DRAFT_409237 [Monoraphidium minutum]|nr:MAG: hypothetical protein J3K34DRAFT_409237 [Monoraphidium minutum]
MPPRAAPLPPFESLKFEPKRDPVCASGLLSSAPLPPAARACAHQRRVFRGRASVLGLVSRRPRAADHAFAFCLASFRVISRQPPPSCVRAYLDTLQARYVLTRRAHPPAPEPCTHNPTAWGAPVLHHPGYPFNCDKKKAALTRAAWSEPPACALVPHARRGPSRSPGSAGGEGCAPLPPLCTQ